MDSLSDTEASVSLSRCPSSPPGTPSRTSVSPSPSATSRREASAESFSLGPVPYASTDPAPEPFVASSDEDKAATAAPGYKTPPNTKTADEQKQLAESTPVKPTVSSTHKHSVEGTRGQARRTERRMQYAAEMESSVVEMPFDEFMSKFMPGTDIPAGVADTIPKIKSDVLWGGEEPICEELCKVAQAIFDKCDSSTEKLVAKDTNRHPDPTDSGEYADKLRTDVCFYPADGRAAADYTVQKPRQPYQGRTCWAWLSLLIEVKTYLNQCAFGFTDKAKPKKEAQSETVASASTQEGEIVHGESSQTTASTAAQPAKSVTTAAQGKKSAASTSEPSNRAPKPISFLRSGLAAQQSLGQIAEYVAKTLRRQHRLHLFTMLVFHGQARVMRWDRAGAIVSTPIDFEKDPSLLHRVVWNYAHMDRVARGHDPTVSLASADEIKKMRACKYWSPDNWVEKRRDSALSHPGWPVYKITMRRDSRVTEELTPIDVHMPLDNGCRVDAECEDSFIIGKCHFASGSPTGRGTRCYIAYDVAYDRLVFLKDFWRSYVNEDASPSEGGILTLLRTNGVTNVPTPLAHEDVQNPGDRTNLQETLTQHLLDVEPGKQSHLPVQRHYRLVVKEICRPLEDHEGPYQLVECVFDAVDAHRQAYAVKVLHRDLSPANILIFAFVDADSNIHFIGVLNDWDLARLLNYLNKVTRPGRSGTWQFMSSRLLRTPGKKHELAGDLESVIYILRWESLRFYKTSLKAAELRDHVVGTYERYMVEDGREIGGGAKLLLIEAGHSGFKLKYPKNPLSTLLETLAKICQEHYLAVETETTSVAPATVSQGPRLVHSQARLDKMRGVSLVVGRPPAPAPPPVSTGASSLEKHVKPEPRHEAKLSSHNAVITALLDALSAPAEEWDAITKVEDQFATFTSSPELQRHAQHTSELSEGSKRSRASDDQTGGRAKRARSGTTSQLPSVAEYDVE